MVSNFELIESQNIFQDILLPLSSRENKRYFYQLIGVPDNSQKYFNDVFLLDRQLNNKCYIRFENNIPLLDISEIVKTIREAFKFKDLTQVSFVFEKCFNCITGFQSKDIAKYFKKHFIEICEKWFQDTKKIKNVTFDMAVNFGVKMFCWTTKAYNILFKDESQIPKVLYWGNIKEQEVYFLEFLFNVGCDILYINTKEVNIKELDLISKKNIYNNTCELPEFPRKEQIVSQETSGLQAKQEVDSNYYDTNVIRPFQFQDYNVKITPLKFSYEELWNLWKADSNIRPGFKTLDNSIYIPTICCKINGIETDKIFDEKLESLSDDKNCIVFDSCELLTNQDLEPIVQYCLSNTFKNNFPHFYISGKFQKEDFRDSSFFKYKYLRQGLQDNILKIIENQDTSNFKKNNWREWNVYVSILLNLKEEILKLLQQYDYGFQVPKIIVYHNNEEIIPSYSEMLINILWQLGFDILFFSPMGYSDIENIDFESNPLNIFQLDKYTQDFKMPFQKKKIINKESFFERIFKKI